MNIATQLLKNKSAEQTVFTSTEIRQLCDVSDQTALYSALTYATKKGYLHRITRGIYALSPSYSKTELANKLRKPSYISLYTVLQSAGVVFQPYTSIFVVTNRSEEIQLDGQNYIYRKIKNEILLNPLGIENRAEVSQATKERALCDKLYLDGDEFFDNLRDVNWDLMAELNQKVYQDNETITRFIKKNI
jgi:predicted transcriptional regulator of viral defense system